MILGKNLFLTKTNIIPIKIPFIKLNGTIPINTKVGIEKPIFRPIKLIYNGVTTSQFKIDIIKINKNVIKNMILKVFLNPFCFLNSFLPKYKDSTNVTEETNDENTPIKLGTEGPVVIQYKIDLMAAMIIPPNGPKIKDPISIGTSLKSIFKYGTTGIIGNAKNIKIYETPAKIDIFNKSLSTNLLFFIENTPIIFNDKSPLIRDNV